MEALAVFVVIVALWIVFLALRLVWRVLTGFFRLFGRSNPTVRRAPIPSKVKREVWRRDQGRCAHCGSRYFLEYDHIYPVSLGGHNTVRNVQLLCEKCNRSKGAKVW